MEAVDETKVVSAVQDGVTHKKITKEPFIFLIVMFGAIWYLGSIMGVSHLFSTIMKTAFDLLLNTGWFVTAIMVMTGALSSLLAEFGVTDLIEMIISPLMRPIFGLPGVASLGVVTCFLSDNPAVLSLGTDKRIRRYFKKYEIAALTNMGTAFGMGLVVFTFMVGYGYILPTVVGIAACVVGSCISTRLMLMFTKRYYKSVGRWEEQDQYCDSGEDETAEAEVEDTAKKEKGNVFTRFMNSMLDGASTGVTNGLRCIPGILTTTTIIMMVTLGPSVAADGTLAYTGKAYEGIALLPKLGDYIGPVLELLFGFKSGACVAFPLTSMGAVGAALGTLPAMLKQGFVNPNDIAVFTAVGMCYSGYLGTHISMMDVLGKRELAGYAILSHTIGGFMAGIAAHLLYMLVA
jgi:hypothetical protein